GHDNGHFDLTAGAGGGGRRRLLNALRGHGQRRSSGKSRADYITGSSATSGRVLRHCVLIQRLVGVGHPRPGVALLDQAAAVLSEDGQRGAVLVHPADGGGEGGRIARRGEEAGVVL